MTITRVWQAGAELGDLSLEFTSTNGAVSASTDDANTGAYAIKIPDNASGAHVNLKIPGTRQIRVGFYIVPRPHRVTNFDVPVFYIYDGGFNVLVSLFVEGDNDSLKLVVNGFVQGTVISPDFGTWQHWGFDIKIDSSAGWVYMYKDGQEYMSFQGDTGDADIDTLRWGSHGSSNARYSGNCYIDDAYIDDATGESAAAPVSNLKFAFVVPNGNGSNSEWTGSDADQTDNYALVDDIPPDDDTSYIVAGAANLVDTYEMDDVTLDPGWGIGAVIPIVVAKKTDAGADVQIEIETQNAGGSGTSSAQSLGTDYTLLWDRQTTQPDASDWNESDFNASEFGVRSEGTFS